MSWSHKQVMTGEAVWIHVHTSKSEIMGYPNAHLPCPFQSCHNQGHSGRRSPHFARHQGISAKVCGKAKYSSKRLRKLTRNTCHTPWRLPYGYFPQFPRKIHHAIASRSALIGCPQADRIWAHKTGPRAKWVLTDFWRMFWPCFTMLTQNISSYLKTLQATHEVSLCQEISPASLWFCRDQFSFLTL